MSSKGLASIFGTRRPKNNNQNENIDKQPLSRKQIDKSCLGAEQSSVFDVMENTNKNLFITGKAGSGKSYLINFFVKNTQKKVVMLAPTGVAAINIGGQTIHSFFRIPTVAPFKEEDLVPPSSRKDLYKCLDTIVIDEVSMIRADIMDAIDKILRSATEVNLPFGGKQILMVGDLYQLPPVTQPQLRRYLDDYYGGIYFFNAPALKNYPVEIYELKHIFRQKDPNFIHILNEIREGEIAPDSLSTLNERAYVSLPTDDDKSGGLAVVIAPTKDAVERTNEEMLNSLDEPTFVYDADIEGDFRETEFPTQRSLKLKVGARVMMLTNDQGPKLGESNEGSRWVNGTLGQISRLSKDSIWVAINGVTHQLDRKTWIKRRYTYDAKDKRLDSKKTASFTQFPVTLAWATTIHKAQGATYKSVGIDLDKGMFAVGQTYVALSRCVDMNNLYLSRPIDKNDILTSDEVKEYMRSVK